MDESDVERVLSTFVDASASVLGLDIRPEWHANVLANMKTIAAASALVHAVSLDDELEAAPVFSA